MLELKDSPFMTAAQKEKVLRHWELFLRGGMKPGRFTKDLYAHLINHCSFIAHYDRGGFYNTYFVSGDGKVCFLSQFDKQQAGPRGVPPSLEGGDTYWCTGDYKDVNQEMIEVAATYIPKLLLEAATEQKNYDISRARQLLKRHDIHV